MRLVIDMQGAQSEASGTRGVGRYTRELTRELIECSKGEIEIFLVLNGNLECEKTLRYFEKILDREHIKVWNFIPDAKPAILTDHDRVQPIELFREWYLHQFQADAIWVTNYQEGYAETGIATTAKLTRGSETIVSTLHDVTPLLYKDMYLAGGDLCEWYLKKIGYVADSDIVLTDSEFSKEKINELVGIDKKRIKTIYCGYDNKLFYPDCDFLSTEKKEKYFLYVGGTDPHKNLKFLIKAYAELDNEIRENYHLKLVGKSILDEREEIQTFAKGIGVLKEQIEYAGYVTDDDMRKLMQRCTCFVFPAFAEGFGLPPLEAMACGAPTIVADATSLAEIVTLNEAKFDPFIASDLTELLRRIVTDKYFMRLLIEYGLDRANNFTWEKSANELKKVFLEVPSAKGRIQYTSTDLCRDLNAIISNEDFGYRAGIAKSVVLNTLFSRNRHIYVDASSVVNIDQVSGIQRVVNALAVNLKRLSGNAKDFCVKVIYSTPAVNSFYEAHFNGRKYVQRKNIVNADIIDFSDGDILLLPDLHPQNVISKEKLLKKLILCGVKVFTIVYDTIPIHFPKFYNPQFIEEFSRYLKIIAGFSGVIADSDYALQSYLDWCMQNKIEFAPYFLKTYNYLGSDTMNANPSKGFPDNFQSTLEKIRKRPSVLMVGTIEPRKGHACVLSAMENLWQKNKDINLIFVGRNGWLTDDLIERMNEHPQNGVRFFWLSDISDECLDVIYQESTGVVVASLEEGYGLPIIEAARMKKPLLLRDIPVFREVAGKDAEYFKNDDPEVLSETILAWLDDISHETNPDSGKIRALTWEESTKNLFRIITSEVLECKCSPEKTQDIDPMDYVALEKEFRGSVENIKKRQEKYIPYFLGCENVLDIGSGRGEFLDILREQGISSEGVDLVEDNVMRCRERGLKVYYGDGIYFLKSKLEWDGLFCSQVIEHLSFDQIIQLCMESFARLKKESYFIIETPNPCCVDTFTNSFYADPTHKKPIHPYTLKFLLERIGFSSVSIEFTEESRLSFQLPMISGGIEGNTEKINGSVAVLNDYLFGSMDYAVIARK